MFEGLTLTNEQARAIAALGERFAAERIGLLGDSARAPWSAQTKVRMEPFIELQRLTYRRILRPDQLSRFDANTSRVIGAWRTRGAYPSGSGLEGGR